MNLTQVIPEKARIIAEGSMIWGVSAVGWLSLIQPALTALATILAIVWTARQLYLSFRKK